MPVYICVHEKNKKLNHPSAPPSRVLRDSVVEDRLIGPHLPRATGWAKEDGTPIWQDQVRASSRSSNFHASRLRWPSRRGPTWPTRARGPPAPQPSCRRAA
eukprot:3445611-Pyramimonas_sp.AAC.1